MKTSNNTIFEANVNDKFVFSLLELCNHKWREQKQYHNLTPSFDTIKFTPASKVHRITEDGEHYIVILDAGIRGMPKFTVTKSELRVWNQRYDKSETVEK